jgi:hypothetical protein
MADERYNRTFLPEPDTEVDPEPPTFVRVRYAPHRIEQTLHFPLCSDDDRVLPNVFFTR